MSTEKELCAMGFGFLSFNWGVEYALLGMGISWKQSFVSFLSLFGQGFLIMVPTLFGLCSLIWLLMKASDFPHNWPSLPHCWPPGILLEPNCLLEQCQEVLLGQRKEQWACPENPYKPNGVLAHHIW